MKDAYWFRHDSNARNDEKIIDLRGDLGYEGYGIYWALIEFLRDTENYEAEYKPKRLEMALQAEEGLVKQVIEGYKLFCIDANGMFYSESLKARMKEMDKKREQQRQKANKRWNPEGEKEADKESHGNATALPEYSQKSRAENRKEQEKRTEKNTVDERVQGEKGETSFFSDCLSIKNVDPVILFFEYLYFANKSSTNSVRETRMEFLIYWEGLSFQRTDREIVDRILIMAKLGFGLPSSEVKKQYEKFLETQNQEKSESEFYFEFLGLLKKQGFKPSQQLKVIASDYLIF